MSTPFKMKGHTLPGPMQKKINPFSKEYKSMTRGQKREKYGEDLGRSKFKGASKSDGTKYKAINRENVAISLGKLDAKIKGALSSVDKAIKGPEGGSYLKVSKGPKGVSVKRTAGVNPNPGGGSKKTKGSGFKPVTFKGKKGDPYSYRTTKSGGYEFSKDGTNFTKATNQKAIDAISKIAPIKMKKKSSKKMMGAVSAYAEKIGKSKTKKGEYTTKENPVSRPDNKYEREGDKQFNKKSPAKNYKKGYYGA